MKSLEILTFTGIDILSNKEEALKIYEDYFKVEFGVLVGGHNGEEGYNRFPPLDVVAEWLRFSKIKGLPLAIHLCGKISRDIMNGSGLERALKLCKGFGRVQINSEAYDYERIAKFAERVSCPKIILQRREGFEFGYPLTHPKIEYLFDMSGGAGKTNFEDWPAADEGIRSGYAGGLRKSNIDRAISFIRAQGNRQIWLDMESGVRTQDNWLDFGEVKKICQIVFQLQ